MLRSSGSCHQTSGSILYDLQPLQQLVANTSQQTVAAVQSRTENWPLITGRLRFSDQHDTYVLSDEVVEAKRHRRREERRYRRTGLPSDKRAFKAACNAARTSIMASRADHIRALLQQASGDIRATWRTAQSLLHSRQKVIYNDSECADLVGKFSSFFVDKVRRIRDNIASALQQFSPRPSYRISSR